MHHTQPPAEENQPQNIENRTSRVQQCVFALRVQFVNVDGFIPVRDEREFGDFPAGAGQGERKNKDDTHQRGKKPGKSGGKTA